MIFNIVLAVIAFTFIAMVCYFLGLGYLIDKNTRKCNDKR